ncbi:hypothetical protein GLOIN_2v1788549 [Rhizophagus irregularis DAOM 181602=DAOM 197198]|nr:hypothetical protein GLOIN_2v1788549 [Rhizophagus irregularis DAOM 181602=DAOM 197198]
MICDQLSELTTYTSAFATYAIKILTGNTLNTRGHSMRQHYGYDDIDDDENVYDHKKKDVSTWDENVETVEDEEPPPPYDNSTETKSSFTNYPTTQTETKPSLTISTITFAIRLSNITTQSTPTHSPTNSTSRRRQFRVHRGRTQNVVDGARSANSGTSCICTNPTH